jgi:hypothetical protein
MVYIFPSMEQGITTMDAFDGFEDFTHMVEWDQGSLDRAGDWGFDTKYECFTSESGAVHFCNKLKGMMTRNIDNISWRKIGKPLDNQ